MSDCLTYAIHYLSKYPKTVHDTRQLLARKGFSNEDIDATIPQLEKNGYLDDTAYTRAYLNSEVSRKGKPLLLVKQKLVMKGIEKQLLQYLIEEMEEDMHEGQSIKIAKEIVRLREKGKTNPEIIQTLVKKGFLYGQIQEEVLKNSKDS